MGRGDEMGFYWSGDEAERERRCTPVLEEGRGEGAVEMVRKGGE